MKIILYQPEIPQNTGNIVRTCSITGSSLLMVRPLGFNTSNRLLKRAGLDYWKDVEIDYTDNLMEYLDSLEAPFYFFSSKAHKPYSDIEFSSSDHLIFGSETTGLPEIYHKKYPHRFYTIPMRAEKRSLNLANSVSIVLYEGLRQQKFATLYAT